MVAWVYSRPLPSEKNSPFAAQLKIAFRRFLLGNEMMSLDKHLTQKG